MARTWTWKRWATWKRSKECRSFRCASNARCWPGPRWKRRSKKPAPKITTMHYEVVSGKLAGRKTDALIVNVFEGEKPVGDLEEVDDLLGGLLAKVLRSREFEPKANKTLLLHTNGDRVLLVGGGKRAEHDFEKAFQMAGTAVRALPSICRSATFFLRGELPPEAKGRAISEGVGLALFRPDFYKSDRKDSKLERIEAVSAKEHAASVQKGLKDGEVMAEATNFARRLADEPSNLMTPTLMAEAALGMPDGAVKVEILERKDMERLK